MKEANPLRTFWIDTDDEIAIQNTLYAMNLYELPCSHISGLTTNLTRFKLRMHDEDYLALKLKFKLDDK